MLKSILIVLLGLVGIVFALWALRYERHHDITDESRRGFLSWIRDLAYVDVVGAIGVYFWFAFCLALIVVGFRGTHAG